MTKILSRVRLMRVAAAAIALPLLCISAAAWVRSRPQKRAGNPVAGAVAAASHTNKLAGATSPYLLEHAHNPVNWYPWGPEALERARAENKPIFLSVGYSACHWCHVMAREDFENEEIAGILNAHFVAIKVDREQRPDIDAQYMLALQMMTGSGGWPMSLFLTSDRKPFYGGTYFPPAEFKNLLNKIVEVVAKQPEAVRAQADRVQAAVAEASRPAAGGPLPGQILARAGQALARRFDRVNGGFAVKPKFPEAPNLAFLLARYRKTGDKSLLAMVTTTLDKMADGGIYDQIGGGFHRYSTDAIWRVPHFEKMLYDQAQLVLVYLDAYENTHNPRYKRIVEETLAFVSREMRDKDGGFTSTLDADSEGEEGKFYLWTPAEVEGVLRKDAARFNAAFGVTEAGDLDGKSVLHVATAGPTDARPSADSTGSPPRIEVRRAGSPGKTADPALHDLDTLRAKLFAARSLRVRPHTDDKVLASWNGLMIAAYAHAFQVLGEEQYRKVAEEAARFLTSAMMPGGRLNHAYRAGVTEVPGLLEDYADTAYGLLALADATHDDTWRKRAEDLSAQMVALFLDKENGGFYSSASLGDLLARMKDGEDNAVPSPNGIAAIVLARLAVGPDRPAFRRNAVQTVQAFQALETRAPGAFPTLLTAWQDLGGTEPLDISKDIVAFRAAAVTGRAGSTVTVRITMTVRNGWHVNAHSAAAPDLIPTTVTLARGGALLSVRYPAAVEAKFAFSPDRLRVYSGEATITAAVKVPAGAARGPIPLQFDIRYQACNDRSCLAPAHAVVRVPITLITP